jgi:hypothetical protein
MNPLYPACIIPSFKLFHTIAHALHAIVMYGAGIYFSKLTTCVEKNVALQPQQQRKGQYPGCR